MKKWNTHELAWAAGFFDGEGCLCVDSSSGSQLAFKVYQADIRPLERFQTALGFGKIMGPYKHSNPLSKKPGYSYVINKWELVQQAICCLWNYLSLPKQEQIRACFISIAARKVRKYHRKGVVYG